MELFHALFLLERILNSSGIIVGNFCGFTWSGRCDSLTGCQPSPYLRGGGGKAGRSHLPEAPCQPTEKSQKPFSHNPSKIKAFQHFLPTIIPEEPDFIMKTIRFESKEHENFFIPCSREPGIQTVIIRH